MEISKERVGKKIINTIAQLFNIWISFDKQKFPHYYYIIENQYGHKVSREKKVGFDKDGNPIPWYTYPAIEYLSQFDLKQLDVFEWGSGNSSLFYAAQAKSVKSIEHDENWYLLQKEKLPQNATILLAADETDYVQAILKEDRNFDIIVIDGTNREECAKLAPQKLNSGGIIVFDNSDRHPEVTADLRALGFLEIDFMGLGPANDHTWVTSIFFDRQTQLTPKTVQPRISIGSGG